MLGFSTLKDKTQTLTRINGHQGTKTQSKTVFKKLTLCFGVLVAKMFLHKMQRIHH